MTDDKQWRACPGNKHPRLEPSARDADGYLRDGQYTCTHCGARLIVSGNGARCLQLPPEGVAITPLMPLMPPWTPPEE